MTDLRKAAEMAAKVLANALSIDFNDKRDWYSYKHDVEYATNLLVQALAQPEQKLNDPPAYVEPPTSDYHNGWEEGFEAAKNLFKKESAPQNADPRLLLVRKDNCIALAQPEQEEPLPLVDIGVDVTPEGAHVVACYNRPDAVQEMFYSQFHPLTKPEQKPVCNKDPSLCGFVQCQLGKVCKHTAQLEQEPYCWVQSKLSQGMFYKEKPKRIHTIPLYTAPLKREWVGLTDSDIALVSINSGSTTENFVNGIEFKLKELNT